LQNCIERSEPVVLIGECGAGKSHLATGVCLAAAGRSAACDSPRPAALVNELVEAKLKVALLLFLGLDHKQSVKQLISNTCWPTFVFQVQQLALPTNASSADLSWTKIAQSSAHGCNTVVPPLLGSMQLLYSFRDAPSLAFYASSHFPPAS
jgi:hypothetical protein